MTVSALDQKTVQLMANQMIMESKTTLTQYEMTKWTLEKTERGISMIIVFKRMVTSELLTTYMPSLLLIFTTYATTFFKPFYFEAGVYLYLYLYFCPFIRFSHSRNREPDHNVGDDNHLHEPYGQAAPDGICQDD